MPIITPHRRRILTLRHRQRTWQQAEDTLFDRDGRGLFYSLCLAKEGVGTDREAFDVFECSSHELLFLMEEARPDEAAGLRARWTQWFAAWPRK